MDTGDALWCSAPAQALLKARDLGGAIRFARRARGWRQDDLGSAAGYSRSTISRLETSRHTATDLELVRRVVRAVGIPGHVLGELLGIGAPSPTTVSPTIDPRGEEDDPMRRRQLMATSLAIPLGLLTGLDDALALLPAPASAATPAELSGRLAQARRSFDTGHLANLIADLPDLIATAHHNAENISREPAALARLAACYDLATGTLNKIGKYHSSRITADRASSYAALSGSPIAMAAAARSLGIVLRHENRHQLADQVTLEAAARLESAGLASPAQFAAFAQMLCTCAYNAAQAGDRDRALELIGDAERAATRLSFRPVPGPQFTVTPAQVRLYQVGVHWSLGDAGTAIHAGQGLHPSQFPTPERRGRLHTDMARAWWQWGKPEPTTQHLLAAYHHAPSEVRDRPNIRAIATTLAAHHPRVTGVRQLATSIGRRP